MLMKFILLLFTAAQSNYIDAGQYPQGPYMQVTCAHIPASLFCSFIVKLCNNRVHMPMRNIVSLLKLMTECTEHDSHFGI